MDKPKLKLPQGNISLFAALLFCHLIVSFSAFVVLYMYDTGRIQEVESVIPLFLLNVRLTAIVLGIIVLEYIILVIRYIRARKKWRKLHS